MCGGGGSGGGDGGGGDGGGGGGGDGDDNGDSNKNDDDAWAVSSTFLSRDQGLCLFWIRCGAFQMVWDIAICVWVM